MLKFRIIYIISLVMLGVLIVFTAARPMATSGQYSEVQRAQLLEREDRRIIEFDILNREGKGTNYTIKVIADGKLYTESVFIKDGRIFTYAHHFYPERLTNNEVSFAVYKEGEAAPIKQASFYLR